MITDTTGTHTHTHTHTHTIIQTDVFPSYTTAQDFGVSIYKNKINTFKIN